MRKVRLFSKWVALFILISLITSVVQATEYEDAKKASSNVKASVILGDDGGPEVPPIDPEMPLTEIEDLNPNHGPLSIRYVPDIIFEKVSISEDDLKVYAKKDTDLSGKKINHLVTIQDFRNENERDGWELMVALDSEFIPGSLMKMTPYIHGNVGIAAHVEVPHSELILNTDEQLFARTRSNENPPAILSMGLTNPRSEVGIELLIPANTTTGSYSTKILWNLISGPAIP